VGSKLLMLVNPAKKNPAEIGKRDVTIFPAGD
jgi:hypothetical protein